MNRDRQEIDWAEALRGVGAPLWIALAVVVGGSAIYWSVSISPLALVTMLTLVVAAALVFLLSDRERRR
jgi:hypothetical protein